MVEIRKPLLNQLVKHVTLSERESGPECTQCKYILAEAGFLPWGTPSKQQLAQLPCGHVLCLPCLNCWFLPKAGKSLTAEAIAKGSWMDEDMDCHMEDGFTWSEQECKVSHTLIILTITRNSPYPRTL